jgi:hypothetical protein
MNTPADDDTSLPRARLCQLAEVDRGKHGRWQARGLLAKAAGYGLLDLVGAALLDELNMALGPKASTIVWRRIRAGLGVPGSRLEVVVELSTLAAGLVRSDAELVTALPRGESVVVIDLSARAGRAQERYRQFLEGERAGGATEGQGTASLEAHSG